MVPVLLPVIIGVKINNMLWIFSFSIKKIGTDAPSHENDSLEVKISMDKQGEKNEVQGEDVDHTQAWVEKLAYPENQRIHNTY